jgi:hypothetical protein
MQMPQRKVVRQLFSRKFCVPISFWNVRGGDAEQRVQLSIAAHGAGWSTLASTYEEDADAVTLGPFEAEVLEVCGQNRLRGIQHSGQLSPCLGSRSQPTHEVVLAEKVRGEVLLQRTGRQWHALVHTYAVLHVQALHACSEHRMRTPCEQAQQRNAHGCRLTRSHWCCTFGRGSRGAPRTRLRLAACPRWRW